MRDALDFIVIGAQKAGTTSLFEYLRRHPDIALPTVREAPYFSHDSAYQRGWTAYLTSLGYDGTDADPPRKWGTVTPHYMVGGVYEATAYAAAASGYDERTVPLRIRERLPDVQLVAILRNPVERALSHHRMAVRIGRERRSFDEAIDDLLRPAALKIARSRPREQMGYVAWGEYGRILAGYYDVFPPEQILLVLTEDLEHAPAQLLSRIHEFVGVRADFEADNLGMRYRVGAVDRGFSWTAPSSWMSPSSPISPQGVQRTLGRSRGAQAAWRMIPKERQRRLMVPYERTARRVARWNRRSAPNEVEANAKPSLTTLARLTEHYAEEAGELATLLGKTLDWQISPEEQQKAYARYLPRTSSEER
jgi:hypothetical protein